MTEDQLQFSVQALLYTLLFCFVFMLFTIAYLIFINCQPGVEEVEEKKKHQFFKPTIRQDYLYHTNSTVCDVIEV